MFVCGGPALSPGKSPYRTCAVLGLQVSDYRVYQEVGNDCYGIDNPMRSTVVMPFGQGSFNAAPTNCCIQRIIYTSRSSDLPTSSAGTGFPRLPNTGANSTLTATPAEISGRYS